MICSVAMNTQGTSEIKNMTNNNLTPATPEDATSGKTNICKKLKNNKFRWNICICIYIKHRQ